MKFSGQSGGYRRRAVITAAGAAALGMAPILGVTHGHRALAFLAMALQVVLLVAAISFLIKSRRCRPS